MVLDAAEFSHDHADIFCAFGNLDLHQFFDRGHITEVIAHRVEVIEAVSVGNDLQIGVAFADLVVIAMQVAHDRLEADDGLAVQLDSHTQYTVSGWMMRPHVDHDMIGLHVARFILQRIAFE